MCKNNKKNFIEKYSIYIITLILSIISLITINVWKYAENSSIYEINLKENSRINSIYINDNIQNLSNYASDNLIKDNEENILIANKDTKLIIKTSAIDDILISFQNEGVSITRNNISERIDEYGYYSYHIGILSIAKETLNIYSIIIFFISYIIIYLLLKQIINFIEKINNKEVKIKDIILFFIVNFILYLFIGYLLLTISKIILMILLLLYSIYLIYSIKDALHEHIEYAFITLVTIIGLTLLFFIPPLNVPDETVHFLKSYELLDKTSKDDGGYAQLSYDEYNFISYYEYPSMSYDITFNGKNYLNLFFKSNNDKTYTYSYGNTKGASAIPYLPSAILIFIGKKLCFPILLLFILSRGIDLLLSLVLCYQAIKITPHFKKIFFLIMLLPTFLQQSAAINMDWLTNSISLLFIAYVLKLRYQKEKISLLSIIYLIIMELILAFCKFGFFPIAFLILLIPSKKFENIKIKPIVTKILLITFVIVISYINNSSLGGTVSSGSSSSNYYTIKYAILHPVNTMYVYANTILNRLDIDIFRGQFDSYGIYTKTNRSLFTAILIIMYAILFLSHDENNKVLSKKERIVCLCTSCILIAIPYTAMFLCWTEIGSNSINGLHPRYFLIAELLLFIGLSNNLLKLNIKNKNKVYVGCIIFNYCISLFTVIIGFY